MNQEQLDKLKGFVARIKDFEEKTGIVLDPLIKAGLIDKEIDFLNTKW